MAIECEKKFLIKSDGVPKGLTGTRIFQYYLDPPKGYDTLRIRRSVTENSEKYTMTAKRSIGGFTREEDERTITAEEFAELKAKAFCGLEKTRYKIPYGGRILEIDVYPFWKDRCVLEIELENEEGKYTLPEWAEVIADVSEDGKYTNYSLAMNNRS